ncbi:hypothetical protein J3E69DRAFT_332221 [Trichoderma sp. SZMC 28015]
MTLAGFLFLKKISTCDVFFFSSFYTLTICIGCWDTLAVHVQVQSRGGRRTWADVDICPGKGHG